MTTAQTRKLFLVCEPERSFSAPAGRVRMFIRFVTAHVIRSLHVEAGVFTIAYDVARDVCLPDYERSRLSELLGWFDGNLRVPTRFCKSKSSRETYRAICWFKPSAGNHIRTMRELVAILDRNDFFVRMIKTEKPGYVVYEDEYQVAAEPVRDLRI